MTVSLPDAPVLISGQVIATKVDTIRGTGEVTGRTLTLMVDADTGPGFAQVKIRKDDGLGFAPDPLEHVTLYVTQSGYDFTDPTTNQRKVGVTTRFIREANDGDLDRIASSLKVTAGK